MKDKPTTETPTPIRAKNRARWDLGHGGAENHQVFEDIILFAKTAQKTGASASSVMLRPSSCRDHLRGPTLHDCSQAVKRGGELIASSGKADAEILGRVKAIAGRQQGSTLRGGLAERARVLSAQQPGKRGHAALWGNPAEHIAMVRHEVLEQPEVPSCGFLGLAEHDIAFADSDFRKNLSRGGVGDGEIGARSPVLPAALGIMLDDPSGAHAGNRECLGEVADHGS